MLIKGAAALITGAGTGLGRGLAEGLLKAGARVRKFRFLFCFVHRVDAHKQCSYFSIAVL